jgi:hypothetical protein
MASRAGVDSDGCNDDDDDDDGDSDDDDDGGGAFDEGRRRGASEGDAVGVALSCSCCSVKWRRRRRGATASIDTCCVDALVGVLLLIGVVVPPPMRDARCRERGGKGIAFGGTVGSRQEGRVFVGRCCVTTDVDASSRVERTLAGLGCSVF